MKTISVWYELASILVVVQPKMALHKYFKIWKPSQVLNNDCSLTIKEKETTGKELQKSEDSNKKHQKYCKWTYIHRKTCHSTWECNNCETVVRLWNCPGLKRQTVCDLKLAYLELQTKQNKADDNVMRLCMKNLVAQYYSLQSLGRKWSTFSLPCV